MAEMIPFDQRDGSLWLDGKIVPWGDAKIHVLTHGLHFASCVFEGERIYSGRIFKLEELSFEYRPYYRVELASASALPPLSRMRPRSSNWT